jgi:hypothetical protein
MLTLFWGAPSAFTTEGPPGRIGVVTVTGTNTVTGSQQSVVVPLTESPAGSGNYTAKIPAMYPVHGAANVRTFFLPRPAITKRATDLTGGPSAGGTRLVVAVSGHVTKILFGKTPGRGLVKVANGLYSVVTPAEPARFR